MNALQLTSQETTLLTAFRLLDVEERDFQVSVFQSIAESRSTSKPSHLRVIETARGQHATFPGSAVETLRIWLTPTIEADLRRRRIFPALRAELGLRRGAYLQYEVTPDFISHLLEHIAAVRENPGTPGRLRASYRCLERMLKRDIEVSREANQHRQHAGLRLVRRGRS